MSLRRKALGALNRLRRGLGRTVDRPAPGEPLSPRAFMAHVGKLAAAAPAASGPQVSFLSPGEPWTQARAPYVCRLDPAGRLAPFARERIAAALAANPQAWALYTDEALTDASGQVREIVLKPAFDPVLLESVDYFGRLAIYNRERVLALGGWRYEGARGDDDLAQRIAAAAPPGTILHLPFPAFIGPEREIVVRRPAPHPARAWPKVSVIIPSRDAPDLIAETLDGLFERTDYPDFDVTIVDNGSTDPRTLAVYARHAGKAFRAVIEPAPFNFANAVNRGAELTDAPLLLLLNNDIEVLEPGWLKEMVACLDYADVGIVGAKLLYPDRTLQHAGVIAGLGGYAAHWLVGRQESDPGPQGRLAARQSLSVVTGACLMTTRACFDALGGLDGERFAVAYNDVDYCLRARAAGFGVIWTPFARLIHHESATRGSDETEANAERFAREKAALRARHATDVLDDPAFNPWASRGHSEVLPSARADLPPARG